MKKKEKFSVFMLVILMDFLQMNHQMHFTFYFTPNRNILYFSYSAFSVNIMQHDWLTIFESSEQFVCETFTKNSAIEDKREVLALFNSD